MDRNIAGILSHSALHTPDALIALKNVYRVNRDGGLIYVNALILTAPVFICVYIYNIAVSLQVKKNND